MIAVPASYGITILKKGGNAIDAANLKPGLDISICLDVAANELIDKNGAYTIQSGSYEKVDNVIEVGTYANRGGIVDLFSPNYNYPIRLDFFGDNIETIRYFDYQSQKTIKSV